MQYIVKFSKRATDRTPYPKRHVSVVEADSQDEASQLAITLQVGGGATESERAAYEILSCSPVANG